MNSCHYLFTTETFTKAGTGGTGESHGSVHIQCPVGKEITITVFQPFDPKHEKLRCITHIPPQWIKTGISYRNELTEGVHAVTVVFANAPITTTLTKSAEAPCNVHTHHNMLYNGSFWLKGTNAVGQYINTTVTGPPFIDFTVTGTRYTNFTVTGTL
jgi:hypothetical protein